MATEQDYWNQMYANACEQEYQIHVNSRERNRPSTLYHPSMLLDGNQWCALYGEDLQAGVAGFGDTPEKAMRDFDENWLNQSPTSIRNNRK